MDFAKNNKNINEIVSSKYLLIDKIGSGSFGEVFLTKAYKNEKTCDICFLDLNNKKNNKCTCDMQDNKHNNFYVAAKVEEKMKSLRVKSEFKIYKHIHKINYLMGVPKIYDFFETPTLYILFMQLLGPSLEEMLDKYNRQLQLYTIFTLGEQIINLIKSIHNLGYIHRDIKPNNFLIGYNNNEKQIYITDFGLSVKYIKKGKHMPLNMNKSLIGTARYASINMHNGYEPSRRDDLESIGYMLIYLLLGKLPWQGLKKREKSKKKYLDMIGAKKMSTQISHLCNGLPSCFSEYLQYCRNLHFDETPNYNYLINIFKNESNKQNLPHTFEWCSNIKIGENADN
jgi:casein kinase 1